MPGSDPDVLPAGRPDRRPLPAGRHPGRDGGGTREARGHDDPGQGRPSIQGAPGPRDPRRP